MLKTKKAKAIFAELSAQLHAGTCVRTTNECLIFGFKFKCQANSMIRDLTEAKQQFNIKQGLNTSATYVQVII